MSAEKGNTFVAAAMKKVGGTNGIVIDFGGGEPFGKWLSEYKEVFTECDYRTFDYDAATGADIIGDIHAIPMADESCDAIICASVLEHVRDPIRAMDELRRVLRKGGVMFLYVPSIYPYHARKGHYPDLWRFFDDTMQQLFAGFSHIEIHKRGGYFFALSFFVPLQHKLRWVLNPLAGFLDQAFQTEERSTTSGYYVLATK